MQVWVALCLPRLSLESIVEIRVAAHGERARARDEVGRQEERSPRFVLPYVDALVRSRHLQRSRVSPEHYVSQRHGVGASRQWRQCRKRSLEQRAVYFDNPVNQPDAPAAHQCKRHNEADQRCRAGPEVAEKPRHESIIDELRPSTGPVRRTAEEDHLP